MNRNKEFKKGYILVVLAGISWGSTGTLVRYMMKLGVNAEGIAFIRMFFGFLALICYLGFKDKKLLRIDKKGLVITAFMGLFTQTLFNYAFFNSIELIGVASATVLLYLSPIFILFWSVIFFKEKVNVIKIIGVIICVIGSYLAVTGGVLGVQSISVLGVILGVISALSYSLVSVFSKCSLKKYRSETIVLYSFMFGFIFTLPMVQMGNLISYVGNPNFILLAFGLGTISSSIPYVLYFNGISTGIDLSKVGVLSMIELLVSIGLSVILVGEYLSLVKVIGVGIIIISIIIIKNSDSFQKKTNPIKI